jgi:hypothetical protein
MIHQGERLPLGFEASQHFAVCHAGLDSLQRYLTVNGLHLFGEVNHASASFSDFAEDSIGSEILTRIGVTRFADVRERAGIAEAGSKREVCRSG